MTGRVSRVGGLLGSRRGVILPVALFFLLALGALAMSVVAVVHTESLLERGGLTYLEQRAREEGSLQDPAGSGAGYREMDLPGGFVMLSRAQDGPGPAAVRWRPDPDTIAAALPGAAEVGEVGSITVGGVALLDGCAGPPEPPIRRIDGLAGRLPDPPLPERPRVGVLDVSRLLDLPGVDLDAGALPPDSITALFRTAGEARIEGGAAAGVVASPGDLTIGGSSRFTGVVMAVGDVRLEGEARIEGVVLAGGRLTVSDDGLLLGCPLEGAEKLVAVLPSGTFPVSAGGNLGRF